MSTSGRRRADARDDVAPAFSARRARRYHFVIADRFVLAMMPAAIGQAGGVAGHDECCRARFCTPQTTRRSPPSFVHIEMRAAIKKERAALRALL